jgi:hypothetical protein
VVNSISEVSALLQATADLPRDTAELRITQARRSLDEVARKLRDHLLAGRGTSPGLASKSSLGGQNAERAAPHERMARTARTLQAAAADYAALLEQRAALSKRPGPMDYPTEIKRWQAFADQAGQMARRWEQSTRPEAPPDTGQDRA